MSINLDRHHRRGSPQPRQQQKTKSSSGLVQLVLGLALVGWILLVLSRRRQSQLSMPILGPAAPTQEATEVNYAQQLPGSKDFRFLLAILSGVALGVGAAALQKVYELASWRPEFIVLVVFWVASFTAVVLVYLAVKYGSVVFDLRIDATENVLLMIVTIAECGMFVSVGLGSGPNLDLRWFISLSAFGLFAFCMTSVVRRRLIIQLREHANEKLREHVRSLPGDIAMALFTCLGAVIYITIDPHPPALSALIAGAVIELFLVVGIIKQRQMRRRIFS